MDNFQQHSPLHEANQFLRQAAAERARRTAKVRETRDLLDTAHDEAEAGAAAENKLRKAIQVKANLTLEGLLNNSDTNTEAVDQEIAQIQKDLAKFRSASEVARGTLPGLEKAYAKAEEALAEADRKLTESQHHWAAIRFSMEEKAMLSALDQVGAHLATLFAIEQYLPKPRFHDALGIWEKTTAERVFACFRRVGNEYDKPSLPYHIGWLQPYADNSRLPRMKEAVDSYEEKFKSLVGITEEDA